MTFNEIEKEFDEYCLSASHTLGESLASVQVYNHRKSDALMLKSFLKQSFIKYLQNEVRILESKIETIGLGVGDKIMRRINTHPLLVSEDIYTGYEIATSDQITHITNQIKELEV